MAARTPHALITGGSRGIGLATAQLFASKGYRCTLIARSEDSLKAAVSALPPIHSNPQQSPSHGYIAGSISSPKDFWSTNSTSPFTQSLPRPSSSPNDPSRIDVLVHCAGISQSSLLLRTPEDEIQNIISTNLTSLIIGTRFLLRNGYIRGRPTTTSSSHNTSSATKQISPSPSIILLSSLLGVKSGFGATSYAASKAGILGFTRALAAEYSSHHVRVNAIVPGYIDTDMTEALSRKELCAQIPLGRFGTADEVASAALWLAESEYAHNCVVNLDGGLSAT